MKILVTGGAGFVGRHLLRELSRRYGADHEIVAVSRGPAPELPTGVVPLRADLRQLDSTLRAQLRSSEVVFHVAANADFQGGAAAARENLATTRDLVEALRKSPALRQFVFTSTIGAVDRSPLDACSAPLHSGSEPSPRSAYGRSKLEGERLLASSGLPVTIFRPTWVYGVGMRASSHLQRFVSLAARERATLFSLPLPGLVSLIHVEALVDALAQCVERRDVIGRTFFAETERLAIDELLTQVWTGVHGAAPRRLPRPPGAGALRFVHAALPPAAAILLTPYLHAHDPGFRAAFGLEQAPQFEARLPELLADNVDLTGQVVVTGAGGGIGLEVTRLLARRGRRVLAVDKDCRSLAQLAGVSCLEVDLRDAGAPAVIAATAEGRIKALINNAGVGFKGALDELSEGQIDDMLAVNARAPLQLTRLLSRRLRRDRSTIVNVASSVAYNPLPGMSVYAATKALLLSWSAALGVEWDANRVVTISPAGTATGFQRSAGVRQSGRLLDPTAVAAEIVGLLEGGPTHTILGTGSRLLVGGTRLLPVRTSALLWGRLFDRLR